MAEKSPRRQSPDRRSGKIAGRRGAGSHKPDSDTSADRTANAPMNVPIVGIGASAGGIEALGRFFQAMPADSDCAFVVVLHLDPDRESEMAHILSAHSAMPVAQVEEGMRIAVNHVYVIAPDTELKVEEGQLHVAAPTEPRGRRHPVDVLFASIAREGREGAIAIVLSGTGSNGTEGLKAIRAEGGMSLVQTPETAKFDGMPRSAIAAGLADQILSPEEMPRAILRYVRHRYVSAPAEAQSPEQGDGATFDHVIDLLRARGHDFGGYKKSTQQRRIHRRMGLRNIGTLSEYVDELRTSPDEMEALVADLLISVTSFFRDTEAWNALAEAVIAPLVAKRQSGEVIRIWVPACATGEEAYSIAMLVTEKAEAAGKRFELRIFATDAQESNLRKARDGIYPAAAMASVSPEHLRRFFEKLDGSYQVSKELRDMVLFAAQNLLRDPPFSRMDLVSCRNCLIYLDAEAQQKIITLCHFGLREGGYLFLGNAETIGRHDDLFETESKKWRIYRRIGPTRHDLIDFTPPRERRERDAAAGPHMQLAESAGAPMGEVARRILLEHYAPASVLIDRRARILYFHGTTSDYLEQPSGEPTRDLLTMARDGLATRLRAAIRDASKGGASVTANAHIRRGGSSRPVTMTVVPLPPSARDGTLLLVSFTAEPVESNPKTTAAFHEVAGEATSGERALQEELAATRADLRSTIEHLETANEELKAANEEATSMNEELQSTNEELETSKEELQSFNEELNTVNTQLHHKIGELERAANDLDNLLAGSGTPTLFLDDAFRITWFTPAMKELFDLESSDIGRPIIHFARKFSDESMISDAETVLKTLTAVEVEVQGDSGRWYLRRMLPYRTRDNRIAGTVITFSDVTERKRAADNVNEARLFSEAIVETVRQPLLVLNGDLRVQSVNPAFLHLFKVSLEESIGRLVYELGNGQWNIPGLKELLDETLSRNKEVVDYEVEHEFLDIGRRSILLNARKLDRNGGREQLILVAIEDVTERRRAEEHQKILIGELNHRVKNTLAVVQSIASRTLNHAATTEEAQAAFLSRLVNLGRAHDVLTRENWAGASLTDIVAGAVEPHSAGGDGFRIEGPNVRLAPKAALTVAMTLYELGTNAAKYGALSGAEGRVTVNWRVVGDGDDRHLILRWEESEGPKVAPPERKGFGSDLIERALAWELGGKAHVDYQPSGVVCEFDVPIPTGRESTETE